MAATGKDLVFSKATSWPVAVLRTLTFVSPSMIFPAQLNFMQHVDFISGNKLPNIFCTVVSQCTATVLTDDQTGCLAATLSISGIGATDKSEWSGGNGSPHGSCTTGKSAGKVTDASHLTWNSATPEARIGSHGSTGLLPHISLIHDEWNPWDASICLRRSIPLVSSDVAFQQTTQSSRKGSSDLKHVQITWNHNPMKPRGNTDRGDFLAIN